MIGHLVFTAFILCVSVATSLAYQFAMMTVVQAPPTVGLSGVVMSMVACLAVMLPFARINCFFWFVVIVRIFHVPAILLAIWYIGWDIYDMRRFGMTSGINYVAHVSGAMMGVLLAGYYLLFEQTKIRESRVYY